MIPTEDLFECWVKSKVEGNAFDNTIKWLPNKGSHKILTKYDCSILLSSRDNISPDEEERKQVKTHKYFININMNGIIYETS